MTRFFLDLLPYLPGFHNKATDTSCGRELSLRAPVSAAPGPRSGLPHDHHSAAPADPPKSPRGALALPPASAAVWQGPLRPGLPSRPGHSRPKRTVRGEGRSDRRGGLRRGAGKERPAGARPPQRSRRGSGPRRRQAPGPSRAPRQAGPRRGERVLAGGSAGPGAAVPVPAEPCGGRSGAERGGAGPRPAPAPAPHRRAARRRDARGRPSAAGCPRHRRRAAGSWTAGPAPARCGARPPPALGCLQGRRDPTCPAAAGPGPGPCQLPGRPREQPRLR